MNTQGSNGWLPCGWETARPPSVPLPRPVGGFPSSAHPSASVQSPSLTSSWKTGRRQAPRQRPGGGRKKTQEALLRVSKVESHYIVWTDVCQRFEVRKIIQTSVISRSRGNVRSFGITPRSFGVLMQGNFCNRLRAFANVCQRSIYRGELFADVDKHAMCKAGLRLSTYMTKLADYRRSRRYNC